jgi:hypothetical protein
MPPHSGEQEMLSVEFFTNFLSKSGMAIYMKVVFLVKLDNFHFGRF